MSNLESVFVREFKEAVSNVGYKDIYKLQLPDVCNCWFVSNCEICRVSGIEEEYFKYLNGCIVKRLSRNYAVKQRIVDPVTRAYKVDKDGKFVYKDYHCESGSIVVLSQVKIGLPNIRRHKPSKGYGYVDFVSTKGNRVEYMYVLPRDVLYKVNQTALAISVKSMKNYTGMGYKTWSNGEIYIHVIPYKPNLGYSGTRILKTGCTLDYSKEIKSLLSYWSLNGIIPDLRLCKLETGENIATKATVVGYDSEEYIPISLLPLSDKEVYGEEC